MQQYRKNLGKVSLTAEGAWDLNNSYDILSIVYDEHTQHGFISRKAVPKGIDLYNKEYWMPFNVSGYADNNVIILSKKTSEASIQSYTLEEAIASVKSVGRRPGAILGFYNENSDRLDIGGRWELWQFNSTTISEWEDVKSWTNIYYNYNKFVGWYKSEDYLKKYLPFPEIGCYAFVGSELNEASVYRCDNKYVWNNTTQHAWDYIKVIVDGNVTVGKNGNWFNNGEDTGIPASVKGENGKTPIIRNNNNILEVSYDNVNWESISDEIAVWLRINNNKLEMTKNKSGGWEVISDYIAAWFRWQSDGGEQITSVGKIQITRDGVSWTDLSGNFVNHLRISRYIGAGESLPTSGIAEGTIYAKGPTYDTSDTSHANPIYRLWVYAWKDNTLAWQDNGEFTSIAAGVVQETGNSETEVMSQKVVTEKLSELGSYFEAEEYIRVYTDVNGKFLMGIKADGSFEFAKGVPTPIKKELERKANAEDGKSLIDDVFAKSISHIEDDEMLDIVLDSNGRIIEFTTPHKKVINLDVEVNGIVKSQSDRIVPTKQEFTIVGSSDNVNRYYVDCRHIILKRGHHYRIDFFSDNFQIIENIGSIIFFSALNPAEKDIDGRTIHINSNNLPSNIEDYCPQCDLFIYYWSSLKTGCYLDVTITEICDLTTHEIVKEYASDISVIRQFINAKKAENLFDGDIVTPSKYKLAIASGFDIDVNTGNMYIGGGVSTAEKEDDWANAAESKTCLIIHNLLTKETEIKPIISIGETIGEYKITDICNEFIVPMITGEDEVSCLLRSVGTSGGKLECVVRKYHPSTGIFDNKLLICDIIVGGKSFTFNSNTDLFYLRDETKCEYFEFTNAGSFYFSMGPIKVNNDFYQVFDIGFYSHILAKSSDMIHWQFVTDIPIGAPSEEVDICYSNGRIYATSRGNKGRFPNQEYQGYSTILYYDLKTKTWCQPVVLTGYYVERPTIFAYEDEIYCIQGRGEKVGQNGYRMPRLEKHCLVFDKDLNLRKDVDLTSHINNLHPLIRAYGNTAFAVTSTDKRCISYYQDGNDRSELTVSRLNMDIWKL